MNHEVLGEISDLMMSAEGSSRPDIAEKVKEIIDGLNHERETYLQKVILEVERLWADRLITAVQEASVLNTAIDELSEPESIEWNKRFVRSIRVNQSIRELFLPNGSNIAEEIQKDPSFLMNRKQLEYGKETGREVDLYIPGHLPVSTFMNLIEDALKKPEFGLRVRPERNSHYSTITASRPAKNYHLLIENELKPVSGTTAYNIRKEIISATDSIPKNYNLAYQGLNRMEFLYYCIYTHIENTYNGIEIGILPTLIQDVEFKDDQGRIRAFLSGETSLNSLDFKLTDPANMHERHLLLAKAPESLP